MNNEQTKTPGEALWRAVYPDLNWVDADQSKFEEWASAVISSVLQGAKWVLLEPGVMMLEGDETWSHFLWSWVPAARTRVCDADICRRPISLPSSVRPDGKSEGPASTPSVSSGDAGVDVPPIWQLPPPPTGQQWHRTDWTKEMLPEGWRPLLKGEDSQPDDEYLTGEIWRWSGGGRSTGLKARYRTRRPLPQSGEPELIDDEGFPYSAEPVVEEEKHSNTPITDAFRQLTEAASKEIERVTSERDQLRKELEKATREVPRLEAELAGCGRQLGDVTRIAREQRERADSLTTENAALKERVKDESEQCVTYHNEITRLRSQFRWTPVPLEGITRTDERNKLVVWVSDSTSETGLEWLHGISRRATHYISIESLRQFLPSPPETEEQAMRREFEAWARSSHELRHVSYELTGLMGNYVSSRLQDAWLGYQAAKQSTGGQA